MPISEVHGWPVSTSNLDVTRSKITLDSGANYLNLVDAIATTEESGAITLHTDRTDNPHSVTKTQVGLGNVDNTSDANKPVSTATQTAIDNATLAVTPEQLGCVGDGVTDDGIDFLAALELARTTGNELILREGATYLLGTWSTYSNATAIRIRGNGGTIKGPSTPGIFLSPAADFVITDTTFDGFSYVVSRTAAQTGSFEDSRFDDNTVVNNAGIAFYMERPWVGGSVDRNIFKDCTVAGCIRIGENTYANQDTWRDYSVCHNRIENLDGTSSNSTVGIIVYGLRATVCLNHVKDLQAASGEAWGIYTKLRNSLVALNVVDNIQSTSSSDITGIAMKGTNRGNTASGVNGYGNEVLGNTVTNVGVAGTTGRGIRLQISEVSAIGNYCFDTGLSGIVADQVSGNDVTIIANKMLFTTPTSINGIYLNGSGERYVVHGNTVDNADQAIYISGSGALSKIEIQSNILKPAVGGVIFNVTQNVLGLRILNNIVTSGTYGVLNNGGAGTLSRLFLQQNELSACTTPVSGCEPSPVYPDKYYKRLSADATATSGTGVQPWFPSASEVSLPKGLYRFRGQLLLGTGTTSHTTALAFATSGTIASINYVAEASSAAAATIATSWSRLRVSSEASTVVSAASTAVETTINIEGLMDLSAAGTVLPRFAFSADPTGTNNVLAGTYIEFERIGEASAIRAGAWA